MLKVSTAACSDRRLAAYSSEATAINIVQEPLRNHYKRERDRSSPVVEVHGVRLADDGRDESSEGDDGGGENELHSRNEIYFVEGVVLSCQQ